MMIPADLDDLLAPLERFEAIRRKLMRLGDRIVDLSYANPYVGTRPEARAALETALSRERLLDLQYTPFGGQTRARRAVADALRVSHGLPFAAKDVILTPGAMAALQLALRTVGDPGDEVVVPFPCWLDYPLYARAVGYEPVAAPLKPPLFDLDTASIAEAISGRTCALILSHPGNPTGREYDAEALAELATALRDAEALHGRPITIIADETHRDFARDDHYRSLSAVFDRVIIVYSFGKYHFMQGQRLGYVAVSPEHPDRDPLSSELARWTRITGHATPTSLMQQAVPDLLALRYDDSWLKHWRLLVVRELERFGYQVVHPDATLFVYVGIPGGDDDFDFVTKLGMAGVLSLPAPVFHHRGYFRLSLTGSKTMLERALDTFGRFRG